MRYRLSGPAKRDLWEIREIGEIREIREHLAVHATLDTADRVASDLHREMERLAGEPGSGHRRTDLTESAPRS